MVEPQVELIAVRIVTIAVGLVDAVDPAREANTCSIQAIACGVVIRQRHSGQKYTLDKTGRIVTRSVCVSPEHAERLKIAGCVCRSYWSTVPIDGCSVGSDVSVVSAREEPIDPISRLLGQHGAYKALPDDVALLFQQDEEKCLVLFDRPTDADTKLVPVCIVLFHAVEVVEPVARIDCGIVVGPEDATLELIGPSAGRHLHLACAAPRLGVNGRGDDAHFFHQVRTDIGA